MSVGGQQGGSAGLSEGTEEQTGPLRAVWGISAALGRAELFSSAYRSGRLLLESLLCL